MILNAYVFSLRWIFVFHLFVGIKIWFEWLSVTFNKTYELYQLWYLFRIFSNKHVLKTLFLQLKATALMNCAIKFTEHRANEFMMIYPICFQIVQVLHFWGAYFIINKLTTGACIYSNEMRLIFVVLNFLKSQFWKSSPVRQLFLLLLLLTYYYFNIGLQWELVKKTNWKCYTFIFQ